MDEELQSGGSGVKEIKEVAEQLYSATGNQRNERNLKQPTRFKSVECSPDNRRTQSPDVRVRKVKAKKTFDSMSPSKKKGKCLKSPTKFLPRISSTRSVQNTVRDSSL